MSLFTGSGVAISTPLTESGVNIPAFKELLEFQIAEGTDAIIVCGTTGEPSTMTEQEKVDAIGCAIDTVAGRIPVIAGTGGNNTAKVIEDSKRAKDLGADGLLVVTPYYNKATQAGLAAHYLAIADAVDAPIVVYNVPGRTSLNMTPATLAQIAEHPNIVAMKEASGNIAQVVEMASLVGDSIDLYSGNDDQIVPLLSLGGKGVISVVANIAPRATHDIVAKYLSGDTAGSLALQLEMLPLIKALFTEVNPIPVKAALNMMGFAMGQPRMPLTPLCDANAQRLRAQMEAFGIEIKE